MCGLFVCLSFSKSNRSYWAGVTQRLNARKTHLIKCAMDASFGDMPNEPTGNFSILLVLGCCVFLQFYLRGYTFWIIEVWMLIVYCPSNSTLLAFLGQNSMQGKSECIT